MYDYLLPDYIKETIRKAFFQSGVYVFKNIKTGRFYVGESENVGKRLYGHLECLHAGTHKRKLMQDDFNNFGIDSFRVIFTPVPKSGLCVMEEKYTNEIVKCFGIDVLYSHFNLVHMRQNGFCKSAGQPTQELRNFAVNLREQGLKVDLITERCNYEFQLNYSSAWYRRVIKGQPMTTHRVTVG